MSRLKTPKIDLDILLGDQFDVVCVDNFCVENRLTVGKTYRVLKEYNRGHRYSSYLIKSDTNRKYLFSNLFFKIKTVK